MAWCRVDGREYTSAAEACRYLGLEVKGNSAVRVLTRWNRDNPGHQVVIGPSRPRREGGIKQRLLSRLLVLQSPQFEKMVVKVLEEVLGLKGIHTGRPADGGIDGEATVPILEIKVGIQAKKFAVGNNVGIEPVQRLVGSITARGFERGVFITTSSFTPGAKEEAERAGSKVVLINGDRLVSIMLEKGLGMKRVPVVKQELDEGFFEGL